MRLIAFDAFGTLFGFRQSPGYTYTKFAIKHKLLRSPSATDWDSQAQRINDRLNNAIRKQLAVYPYYRVDNEIQYKSDSREWWFQVALCTFVADNEQLTIEDDLENSSRFKEFSSDLWEHFSTAAPYELYPDTLPALKLLKAHKGLKLTVISNSDERLSNLLKSLGIRELFDLVVDSATVRYKKPNQEMFDRALAKLNSDDGTKIKPAECLYIGDDLKNDYLAPRQAGWKSQLLIRNRIQPKQNIAYIHSLLDLQYALTSLKSTA